MSKKMNWDTDGNRASVRNAGGERTASASSMRHDPIQKAGAEIVLPNKSAQPECENKICQMRKELLDLLRENEKLREAKLKVGRL